MVADEAARHSRERRLDLSRKPQSRVQLCAGQIAARQFEQCNRPLRCRPRDPARAAVVGCGAVSGGRVNNGADLIRSLGEHVDGILLVLVALVSSLGREAGEFGQALGAADGLDVLVENLIGGGRFAWRARAVRPAPSMAAGRTDPPDWE